MNEFRGFPPLSEYSDALSWRRRNKPVLILAWDPLEDFLFVGTDAVRACSVPCLFVSAVRDADKDCMAAVDAVVFNPPTGLVKRYKPEWRFPHQPYVVFLTESEAIWGALPDLMQTSGADLAVSYRLSAQVPMTYFIGIEQYIDKTHFLPIKPAAAPIVMFISNCDSKWARAERGQFIQQLMQHIPVDSYGKCFNNRELPAELKDVPWWEAKWNITAQYRFTLAFENSIGDDYVTEKVRLMRFLGSGLELILPLLQLYHSFVVGSVPIYWGAPNVEKFLPAPNSAIKVDDFGSARELALHIRYLLENRAEYDAMLEWKRTGQVSQSFLDLEKTSPRSAPCRLCEAVARKQQQQQRQ